MSKIVYLIGAGASYGERNKDKSGNIIHGSIKRGLPVVNELERSIDDVCNRIVERDDVSRDPLSIDFQKIVYKELRWLQEQCKRYPTIDTYAKQLSVTQHSRELDRLKNALSIFFILAQSHDTRDLRYDGFIASIIDDICELPSSISILSWNYDYQMEYVLQDFSLQKSDLLHIWQSRNITCKGCQSHIDKSKFNLIKLNGSALFSIARNHELIDPNRLDIDTLEKHFSKEDGSWYSNISFAWEKDKNLTNSIIPIIEDATVLVVIGYSFPYVNRSIDRELFQNMNCLEHIYIQDAHSSDVKQSLEATLSEYQLVQIARRELVISLRESTSQFIIPNELE